MTDLIKRLEDIYLKCNNLLNSIIKEEFLVAGNIAIFAQSEEEFAELSKVAKELTKPSENPNQKYFELVTPITIKNEDNNAEATFTHLYIRKYDDSKYGKNLGDADFEASPEIYNNLKQRVIAGEFPGAEMYDRPGWDTIQLTRSDIRAVAYISTKAMAEKVRIKFDSLTNL